jgi:UDPglucose--hexose-1-phosphate uridylyltransferase
MEGTKEVSIEFYKKGDEAWFLDPKNGFTRKRVSFERRRDCLTGHASRILPYRWKIPETSINVAMLEASRASCPFCPERIPSLTPQFVPEIACEGRVRRGMAHLIPNSFPYSRYSWVVILCEEHFLYLDQLSTEILTDGFVLAQDGLARVKRQEPGYDYGSINWNYLPQSGGGLFHPHLQIVAEDLPTVSHRKVLDGLKNYRARSATHFWEAWLSEEVKRGERYVGNRGDVHFVMAFSPLGILGEILILFYRRYSFSELTLTDWEALCKGLVGIFRFFKAKYIHSFNLSLFSGNPERGVDSWVYGRLCPRISIPPWDTSDINYFEKLHGEVICVVSPEEMCAEMRPFLSSTA